MSVTVAEKAKVIADNQRATGDTGSPEVQVALLTARINGLNDHFKAQRQGSPLAARAAADGVAPAQASRLPEVAQHRQLSIADREARACANSASPSSTPSNRARVTRIESIDIAHPPRAIRAGNAAPSEVPSQWPRRHTRPLSFSNCEDNRVQSHQEIDRLRRSHADARNRRDRAPGRRRRAGEPRRHRRAGHRGRAPRARSPARISSR